MRNKTKYTLISVLSLCMLSAGMTGIAAFADDEVQPALLEAAGASIRYNMEDGKNGIRFPVRVSKANFEAYSNKVIETGTI